MSATPKIVLDASKLYGFRILNRDAGLMVKVGAKMGAKIGGKVGDKIGFKIGLKRSVVQDSSAR